MRYRLTRNVKGNYVKHRQGDPDHGQQSVVQLQLLTLAGHTPLILQMKALRLLCSANGECTKVSQCRVVFILTAMRHGMSRRNLRLAAILVPTPRLADMPLSHTVLTLKQPLISIMQIDGN